MVNFATIMQSSFGGQNLTEELLRKQLQNQGSQIDLADARRQQDAKALVAQVLQQVMSRNGQTAMPTAPKPFQPAQVPNAQPTNNEGTTLPGGGNETPALPGAAAPAGAAAQSQQASPQPAASQPPAQGGKAFSWRQVLEEIAGRKDVDDATRFAATQEIQKQVDLEETRNNNSYQKQQDREARVYRDLQTIEAKFKMAQMAGADKKELEGIRGEYKLKEQELRNTGNANVAGMNNAGRETVAGMNNTSRETIADKNNTGRMAVTQALNTSRETIAGNALALKKELGEGSLDLKADDIAKTFLYREHMLNLREKGMDQQHADTLARLAVTQAIAGLRDDTARRGQDMVSRDKQLAQQFKIDAKQGAAASGLSSAIDAIDGIDKDIDTLMVHPGMDAAQGSIDAHTPTIMQQTANYEADLDSLKSRKMLTLIAAMKAMSSTGSTGFGRITNFEAQALQNSISSLKQTQDPEQMRKNLIKLKDDLNLSKTHMLQAYEQQYGNKATGGPIATTAATPKAGGETRPVPANLAAEPDGTIVKNGGKTFTKQGDKLVETGS